MLRTEAPAPIRWQCGICDNEGVISNCQNSAFDLRRRHLALAQPVTQIVISYETAAALCDLQLLDSDRERLVFAIRADDNHATLVTAEDDLDELIGFVAAEANHEPSRSRRHRLDAAFDALTIAAQTPGTW